MQAKPYLLYFIHFVNLFKENPFQGVENMRFSGMNNLMLRGKMKKGKWYHLKLLSRSFFDSFICIIFGLS